MSYEILLAQTNFESLEGYNIILNSNLMGDSYENIYKLYLNIRLQVKNKHTIITTPQLYFSYIEKYPTYDRPYSQSYNFSFDSNENVYYINTSNLDYDYIHNPTEIISLEVNGFATIDIQTDLPFIKMYAPNSEVMQLLRSNRFYTNIDEQIYNYDLGQFILSYIRYPFSISTYEVQSDIILGFKSTKIKCDLIDKRIYKYILYENEINGYYKDNSDIDNISIYMVLPFTNIRTIDSKYINSVIKIECIIDILINKAQYIIYSDNNIIDTIDFVIGCELPYITVAYNNLTLQKNITSNLISNNNAYIMLEQKPKIENSFYTVNFFGKLNELELNDNSFIQCDSIEISEKVITKNEFDLILTLVKNGIYI